MCFLLIGDGLESLLVMVMVSVVGCQLWVVGFWSAVDSNVFSANWEWCRLSDVGCQLWVVG
jgi:hypothetical protein